MRCPVCRAADNQGPQCRRCKADLGLLLRLENSRARCLATAADAAARGDAATCLDYAREAHLLRADSDSLRLLAVGSLLQRDFAAAWLYYLRILPPLSSLPTNNRQFFDTPSPVT